MCHKLILGRLNHLKSELRDLKSPKMDKILNQEKIEIMEARIGELKWLQNKLS